MTPERRSALPVVASRAGSGAVTVGGIGVPFMGISQDLGGWREQFDSAAFRFQQQNGGFDVVTGDYAHDSVILLGSVAAGTMRVSIEPAGVRYSIDVPESMPYIAELVTRGDLAHSSIFFQAVRVEWGELPDGTPLRTVLDANLFAISLVPSPAYTQATAAIMGGPRALPSRSRASRAVPRATGPSRAEVERTLSRHIGIQREYDRQARSAERFKEVDFWLNLPRSEPVPAPRPAPPGWDGVSAMSSYRNRGRKR